MSFSSRQIVHLFIDMMCEICLLPVALRKLHIILYGLARRKVQMVGVHILREHETFRVANSRL